MTERIQMLGRDLNPGLCSIDVYKELLIAFRARDANKIKRILSNSEVDPDYRFGDPEYGTLLDLCAMEGNCSDLINLLLQHDANPNLINSARKKGPIHSASQIGDIESLRVLVECPRTDLNLLDNTGSTALHYAARQDDPKATAVKLLIKYNANLNSLNRKERTPLHIAMNNENTEAIVALIEAGADLNITGPDGTTLKEDLVKNYPDIKLPISIKQNDEKSNKHEITHSQLFGHLRARNFEEFIQGIKENKHLLEQNDGYHTFLQYCCEFGFEDIVKILLDLGACPNNNSASLRQTPLMLAARRGHAGIVEILLRRHDAIDFSPIDGESPLHCVVNGIQSPVQANSDYFGCLNLLLTKVPKSKLNVNQQDFKRNTALHYAAKLRQHKMVQLLLQHGAYIGLENVMGEAACADIAYNTLSEHLDSCIGTNDALPREDNYEITFNYDFLLPIYWSTYYDSANNLDPENNKHLNKYLQSETKPLLHIAKNRELRPLLKHPIFTSFLDLKWYRIRHYFYINLCFYLLFWAFLTTYILRIYSSQIADNSINNSSSTTVTQKENENYFSLVWLIVTLLLGLLFLRELFQLYISPVKYLVSPENWLEIGIIIITCIILFCKSSVVLKHQISAIGIMLSWTELVLLIGRHPALSTNIEMLKTVSTNFLKFLAWYSILIIAFALSFYSLFKDSVVEEEENFFEDPGTSVFKTVVMLTGEFDTGTIPFVQHPITSHILFVLFVFLIAIVLFNLLNGLAVSDTHAIRSDAELVSVISRAKLVSYLETTLANPSSIIEALSRCLAHTHKSISSINLAPTLPPDHTVRVLVNMGCIFESIGRSSINKRNPARRSDPCPEILMRQRMDPTVVERASHVLINKSERQALKQAQEEEKEKERLLREEIEQFRHSLNNLTEMFQENKNILDNISKALSLKSP